MKNILLVAAALFASVLFSEHAQAIPITGTVDMSGTATLDNIFLGSANAATGFSGVTVGGTPTGAFTGTAGSSVTWSPFNWIIPTLPGTLWSYVSGTRTYSFVLSTVSVVLQNNSFLNLMGAGTLSITGAGPSYDDTQGTWSFTISNSDGGAHDNFAFTFANSQTAVPPRVPDGGLTLALLGFVLMGAEGLRRKLKSN
jgi:hypothetical protein